MLLSNDTRKRIQKHIADLGSTEHEAAQAAERRLIRFGNKAVTALMEVVDSPDPQVRFRAVWALGKIRDTRALLSIQRLTRDADERVRYDAVLALGELGDQSAVPLLRDITQDAAEMDISGSAAWMALHKLGHPTPYDDEAESTLPPA